jgi:hypothetical protein
MSLRQFAVIVATAMVCGSSPAQDFRFGDVVEISSPAAPGSTVPNLSGGPVGRAYMSWVELRADSTHALRFSALADRKWSSPRTISISEKGGWFVNWADFPSLLALDASRLVAHWLVRSGASRYAYDVHIARSGDGGRRWTTPTVLHRDRSEAEHGFVSLLRVGNGVGAVWLDGRKHALAKSEAEGEMTLQFASVDARGMPAAETELDPRVCDCCQTAMASTAAGPIVVYRDRSPSEVRDIAVVRLVNGRWTTPQIIHGDNWVIAACPVNGPAIAANGKNVAVAWFTGADNQARVNVAFSSDAGKTFRRPIRIDDGEPAGRVDVQFMGAGSALVSWLERVGQGAEVRVKRVSAKGRVSEAKTITTSSGDRASGFPHMIYRGRDVVFAWTMPGRPSQVRTAILELTRP